MKPTHPDKIYWKEDQITKGELIDYYLSVSSYILPYLKNRPLVMHRYPHGVEGEAFYQKEAGKNLPSFVKTTSVQHENKKINYILVQNKQTLSYVVNLGSIELHPFHSSLKHLEKPDYMILDLDPVAVPFKTVVETALAIHEILEELGVPNFCKTSGGKGLHIFVPMGGKYDYEQVKHFAQLVAALIHEQLPDTTSLERSPKKRQKQVYLDCLQNNRGQTASCVYSVRARPHAPVSTPLLWKEVKPGLDVNDFTIKTVPKRLSQKGDLFKGVLGKGINLQTCLKRIES